MKSTKIANEKFLRELFDILNSKKSGIDKRTGRTHVATNSRNTYRRASSPSKGQKHRCRFSVSTEIEGSRCVAAAHWLGPLLRSKRRHGIKKGARESVYFYNRRRIESSFGRFAGRSRGRKWGKRSKKKIKRRRDVKKEGGQTHMSADWRKEIMRIGRGRKKERKRERCELSVATANGMCDTRVLLLHDEAALSLVIRELFCQSVRSLSAAFADEPAGPYVRLLWLLTRDLRATSPRSSHSVREEARLPRVQTRRCNVRIYNGCKCARRFGGILTGARNHAGQVVSGNWSS